MKRWTIILTVIVAIENILMAIWLSGNLCLNESSASVLVGALCVIVTFLVAWQIWATIDARNSLTYMEERARSIEYIYNKKLRLARKQIKSDFEKKERLIYGHISALLAEYTKVNTPISMYNDENLFSFIQKSIDGIKYGLSHNDEQICLAHLNRIGQRVEKAKRLQLTNREIDELKSIWKELNFPPAISQFANDVFSKIAKFNEPRKDSFEEDMYTE